MIFCGTQLLPGEQKPAAVPVPGAAPLTAFCFCGKKPGKTLVVTAGVHGCEYVGIQALRRLAQDCIIPIHAIGRIDRGEGLRLVQEETEEADGSRETPLSYQGYDHFRQPGKD